jgi:transposase
MRSKSVVSQRQERQRECERRRRARQRRGEQCGRERRMRWAWARAQGLMGAVIEDVVVDKDGSWVLRVHARAGERYRCAICRERCPYRDGASGRRRRWRGMDCGAARVYVEAEAPRVCCAEHGVVVAAVPWARHKARLTRFFDDQIACELCQESKKALAEKLEIAWRTAGRVCERVCAEARAGLDLLDGLREIGFDEISIRKGQRYMTVVVDHRGGGRLVWAGEGRCRETVDEFLDLLGAERLEKIELVSCDDADWVQGPVSERCPNAEICLDPFHIVKAANDALDELRRGLWNEVRRSGDVKLAKDIKGARKALLANPERLSAHGRRKLAFITELNEPIYRAYLLKEQLRELYFIPQEYASELLDAWLQWASRSQLDPFVKLAKRLAMQRSKIAAALTHQLSNARVEQLNGQLRVIMCRAFGFRSAKAVIALAMLSLGKLCPPSPNKQLAAIEAACPQAQLPASA